jgi:ribosomal protein S18 acetylase RimI-like enzyme
MTLTIRFATEDDAGLIADLSHKTFYETFGYLNTKENMDKFMNEQFTREKLINEVGAPENIFLLVFDEDTPVGYAKMRHGVTYPEFEGKDSVEIARIYVVNSYIGAGVGKELIRKCLFLAKDMKKEIIWLGVWEKNARAISFYTKWGFEKFGEHPFVLGDDVQTDWLMKKQLQ